MWPFKKKVIPQPPASEIIANTILCIPGKWKDIADIQHRILAEGGGDYMIAEGLLFNPKSGHFYKCDVRQRDEHLTESFRILGKVTGLTREALDEIENHSHVLYITGKTGGLQEAKQIALAASAVLRSGGLGIKIDTVGKAFEKQRWLRYLKNIEGSDLFEMFVLNTLVDEYNSVFSCGMQNLGYRDAIVSGEEFQKSVDLVTSFGYYQIFDDPTIIDGQTFQPDAQSAEYLITEETEQPYNGYNLFANPFGMWRLTRVDN